MSLSKKEELFLLTMEQSGHFVFRSSEAQSYWGTPANTANALSRLAYKHWLERLTKGIYLIRALENRGKPYSQETEFLIASHLTPDAVIAYQSAMLFYKMTGATYPSNHYMIHTTHRKQTLQIRQATYQFITVSQNKLTDFKTYQLNTMAAIRVSTPEETLIDSALRPDLCSGIFNVLQFLRQFSSTIDWKKVDIQLEQPSVAPAAKRIGYLIDRFNLEIPDAANRLKNWKNHLSQGVIQLNPKSIHKGHIHTHWAIEDNCFEKKEGIH